MHIDDWRHLEAAEGLVDLGLFNEAADELAFVSLAARDHPKSLEICWRIYSHFGKWIECYNIAMAILAQEPGNAMAHVQLACALEHLKGTQHAYEYLRPIADQNPDALIIVYELACLAFRLGLVEESLAWLGKVFTVTELHPEHRRFYRRLALANGELKPLWEQICSAGRREDAGRG